MELRFLLLLLLYISGFQAQEFDAVLSRVEGQSLTVECHYSSSVYSATRKTWCQLRDEKCSPLVSTYYTPHRYRNKVTSGRATIDDDTGNGIVTITMEKLQVQDSGVYWCARYYPPNTRYPLKTIKLDVSKEVQEYDAIEGQNLSVQCPYNTQDYKKEKKAWCRRTVQNECDVLVNTDYWFLTYQNSAEKGRARIHDDTQKGIVTITMEKLQVDDAGVYWCARYEPPNLYRIIEIKLAVAKATTTSEGSRAATTTRITPADSLLSERNFIILGVVLGVLFILVLIGLVILCTWKSKQLKTRGDGQAEAIYEEPRNDTVGFSNMNDTKDDKQEMPQDLKYATLAFQSRPSPRESVYANITPSRALETPHTGSPTDPVEYASISLKPLASGAKS